MAICDGISMNHEGMKYSLPSREIIAATVESMAKGHSFDGLVLMPSCDKVVPGMIMGAAESKCSGNRSYRWANGCRTI